MVKFFGPILQEIKSQTDGKVMFRFDTKGEFITDDPKIAERAIGHFDHIEMKAETVGERVKKTFIFPALIIESKQEAVKEVAEEIISEPEVEVKVAKEPIKCEMSCKKCDYTTSNKGDLMAHYRKSHKEE